MKERPGTTYSAIPQLQTGLMWGSTQTYYKQTMITSEKNRKPHTKWRKELKCSKSMRCNENVKRWKCLYLLQRKFVFPNGGQGELVWRNQDKVTGANSVGAAGTGHNYKERKIICIVYEAYRALHQFHTSRLVYLFWCSSETSCIMSSWFYILTYLGFGHFSARQKMKQTN